MAKQTGPYQSLVEFPLGQEVCFLSFLSFVCVCVYGPTRDLKRTISVERKGNKNNEATAEARIS